jgi:5,10-methenyltetrahydrofolate synthetase
VEAADRTAARRRLRERRAALGEAARRRAAQAIAARLETLVASARPTVVGAYWAMKEEPELAGAMAHWHAAGLTVALPRVAAADAPLEFVRWRPGAAMAAGPFGTLHPDGTETLRPDLLVIPCLGFDARCYRMGYGGGYYDRTLERLGAVATVGVAYDCCEVAGFEPHQHDLPLDWVVTERRLLGRPRDPR